MDAVKFVEERRRMYTLGCIKKGINDYNTKAEDVVAEVEAWSALHPRKTRQSVFLKMFPHVRLNNKGQPWFCPRTLDTAYHPVGGCVLDVDICQRCKDKFWGQEVE
nr:MAG TPA: hypothetical protein [Caudoviricetes sp.]